MSQKSGLNTLPFARMAGEIKDEVDESDPWSICQHLTQLYETTEEKKMETCEAFITTIPKAYELLKNIKSEVITKVKRDNRFNPHNAKSLLEIDDKDVNEVLSVSFAAILPKGFSFLCLADNKRCRNWIATMFRKHLIARDGVSKFSKMGKSGGLSLLHDLRRITGMGGITGDYKLLGYLDDKFPDQKGEVKMRTANTFSYTERNRNVKLPNCPFFAMGIANTFELSHKVMTEWCQIKEPYELHKKLVVVAKGMKARYLASRERKNFLNVEALEEKLSKSQIKDLVGFSEMTFKDVYELLGKNSKLEANLESVCGRWMHAGMDFTELCNNEVARLVILANFRIHFAIREVPDEKFTCRDVMLASAIANTGDSSLFSFLMNTLFVKGIQTMVVRGKKGRNIKVMIEAEKAHKVIKKESGTEDYITYTDLTNTLTNMDLINNSKWKSIMNKKW